MAQAVRHRALTAEARFAPGSLHAGLVVGKVALGEILLPSFPLSVSFHIGSPKSYHMGDEKLAR
jgi:hypothetical protein